MFGETPARPPKGSVVALQDYDPARPNVLMPHPVYAWMRWVQILTPTRTEYELLLPHLEKSFELVKLRWERRRTA